MADDQMRALRDEVQRLADIEAIKQLKARYIRLVDVQDWEAWGREVLTEDFHFDSDGGVQDGRDVVIGMVSKALAGAQTVHHVHTPEITITGPDTATAIWPMNDYVTMPRDGSPIVINGYGHYNEEYVRTDDGWRLKSCVLTRLRVDSNIELNGG